MNTAEVAQELAGRLTYPCPVYVLVNGVTYPVSDVDLTEKDEVVLHIETPPWGVVQS